MGNGGEKVSWKRVLILAGAVIAFTIGSGFATGQEIIQYYTAYGVQSLLVILVFAVAFLYYNFNFAKAGAEQKFERGNDVYKYFCGKYVGTFCDYYSTLRALIINDDKPAVRKEADGWVVYGTPFSGKTNEQLNRKGKLQGICMLERGKTNEIRRMEPQEAVLLLMRQTLVPRRQEMAERLLEMLDELFKEVPVYQMRCTISEDAAKMAYESMRGEGI